MRKYAFSLLFIILFSLLPIQVFASTTGDPIQQYQAPILITNAGQGPGGKMARLLIGQAKVLKLNTDFFYKSEPLEKDLEDLNYSCLLVVIGSTDKGLGASGITIDDEIIRLEKVVKYAKKINLPIVALLLEKDKRSSIKTNANERCIDLICPASDWMIVVKDGNLDNRFTKISEKYDIPLTEIGSAMEFMMLSKQIFVK